MLNLSALLLDLLLITSMSLTGWFVVGFIHPSIGRLTRLSLSFLVGAGISSWTLFILGWLGYPIRLLWVIAWHLVLLIISAFLDRQKTLRGRNLVASAVDQKHPRAGLYPISIGLVFGIITIYLGYISVGRSYSIFDALSMWAPKGYGIALEGSLWGAISWGNHKLAYPLHVQLLIMQFRLISGDMLPGSKLIFTLFFVSYLMFTYDFLRRRGLNRLFSMAVTLFLASTPLFVIHATIGFANLAMAVYLTTGLVTLLDGVMEGNKAAQVLGSLLLGFTIWTIIEGVLFVIAGLAALVGGMLIIRRVQISWVSMLGPMLVVGGAWIMFYFLFAAGDSQASNAFSSMWASLKEGQIDIPVIRLILGYARRNIFDISTWGYLFPIGLVVGILAIKQLLPNRNPYTFTLILMLFSIGALSLGLFYLRSFEIEGLYDLLKRGFPRGFISPAMLLGPIIGVLLQALSTKSVVKFDKVKTSLEESP